jgi:hypothetical protein
LSEFLSEVLSEVLAKYSLSGGIDSIPLFDPQIYEIQDDNKIFKRCMEEILGRLRPYGTLQPDSLLAMHNEYVVALLHASIHIVMDITDKELSMRPQYGKVGEESRGRVDYAIKVLSQQVGTGTFFYIAPEKYPRQVTLRIRSNLPKRPWTRTPTHINHYVIA